MRIAVATLMAAIVAAGLRWGTFAVGGSDSYCYVHQAQGWATGRLQVIEPLALDAQWPDAPRTFAPAGHVPSPTVPGAAVPMCPAGLSIAMAPFMFIDRNLSYVGAGSGRPVTLFSWFHSLAPSWCGRSMCSDRGSRAALVSPRRCWSHAVRRFCSSSCSR